MKGLEPSTFCMAKGKGDRTTPYAADGNRTVTRNPRNGVRHRRAGVGSGNLTWDLTHLPVAAATAARRRRLLDQRRPPGRRARPLHPAARSSRSRCRARRTDSRPRARRPASSPRPRPAARAVTAPAASSQPVSLGPPDRLGHRVGAADRAAHIPADRRQTSQPFDIATGRCLPARARRDLLRLRLGRCPLPLDRLPRSAPWRTRSRKRRSPSARTNGSRSIRCGTPTRRT